MLFYHPDLSEKIVKLTAEESLHAVRVLRKKNGEQIEITDGRGIITTAKITVANTRSCEVEILKKEEFKKDPFYLHIAIAPTKNIDRTTWFVEKAIEIGIHEISFPICKNSERRVLKIEKVLAKAISAMKQSLSPWLPKINEAANLQDFLDQSTIKGQKFIAHLENQKTPELFDQADKWGSYCILIGPEGDFDPEEINMARKKGFEMVKMGNKRLRTETASLFACSIINTKNLKA